MGAAPHETSKQTESGWVVRIRAGGPDAITAFENMFRAYAPRLCDFAYGYVKSRAIAEEIVQEVFFRLWDKRDEWKVAHSVSAYLYRSVRNYSLNHNQRTKTEESALVLADPPSELMSQPVDSHASLEAGELHAELRKAVATLPERCREVFELRFDQRLSHAQIAEVMEISVKTVEHHWARTIKGLEEALGGKF